MNANPNQVANDLQRALKEKRSADTQMDLYALVFALTEAGRFDDAVKYSDILLQDQSLSYYARLQRAEIELRAGRDKQALDLIGRLSQEHPDDYIVTMEYARMLIQAGEADKARNMLEDYLVFRQGDPNVYRWLSHASKAGGDAFKSHTYMAESQRLSGNLTLAISHLEAALKSPNQDYFEEAIVQAQLKDLREIQSREKKKQ